MDSSTASTIGSGWGRRAELALWATLAAVLVLTATVPMDVMSQATLAWGTILVLSILRRRAGRGILKPVFLILAVFVTLRYLSWRLTETLSFHDPASFIAGLTLLAAELYGITVYLLGMFVNVYPLHRQPQPLPQDPAACPSVDVLIPSYNEAPDLLEITLIAAQQIRYPRDRLQIYLLDDGGTVQKRNDQDSVKAAAAWNRYERLNALCERLGVRYLTRERNEYAKAGNVNAALEETGGDLVLILDADHVPTVDILEQTVGLFVQDPKLFLVQTPHFFINPDPVERNLEVFGQMPSENEMFYSVIQPGLDQWNASFFCGSAALLRRSPLMQAGGFAGETITEDAETALELHSRGYNSAYINRPMISGLQPETFSSFILQRVRWAQGMTQIFLLKNPLRVPGLKLWQRLGYLSSTVFWFFGFARLVFILAPAMYLVFGLHIYDTTLAQFLAYAVPHLAAAMIVANHLFGKVRWAFVSELYELLQSVFSLPAMVKTLMHPREPNFKVTPKGETMDENFVSSLARPFYLLYVAVVLSLIAGVWRYLEMPADRDITAITLGWALVNFVILNAALGALYERRQRRSWSRMPADLNAQLFFAGHDALECRVNDLSVGGALLVVSQKDFEPVTGCTDAEFLAYNDALSRWFRPRVQVRHVKRLTGGRVAVGIMFVQMSQAEVADAVAFAHGDSERWLRFQQSRRVQLGILEGFVLLTRLGTRSALAHFKAVVSRGLDYAGDIGLQLAHGRWRRVEAPTGGGRKASAQDSIQDQD